MSGDGQGRLFIVSGPSGSGKTTVVEELLKSVPNLYFSVSYTTRAPRSGEQEGREYHFVDREEFEAMAARDEFLEHATVFGDLYGTPRSALDQAHAAGRDIVLDIDVQGARQVKERLPEAVAVLLVPPSAQELERRLRQRGQDTAEIMHRRLQRARGEIQRYHDYDYLVINHDIGEACAQVEAIVLAERGRSAAGAKASNAGEVEARAARARKQAQEKQVSAILESFGATAE